MSDYVSFNQNEHEFSFDKDVHHLVALISMFVIFCYLEIIIYIHLMIASYNYFSEDKVMFPNQV